MSTEVTRSLETQLGELFDLRKEKLRRNKHFEDSAIDAKKDIRLLIKIFSDDVPSITLALGGDDFLEWDSGIKRLVYHHNGQTRFIENVKDQELIKIRPHLSSMIKSAKDFYRD
jgi:hypothetical protein